jgi:hypothetical protein
MADYGPNMCESSTVNEYQVCVCVCMCVCVCICIYTLYIYIYIYIPNISRYVLPLSTPAVGPSSPKY